MDDGAHKEGGCSPANARTAASEPEFMATPMSALRSAGASFMPSPVTPTRWPAFWAACKRKVSGASMSSETEDAPCKAPEPTWTKASFCSGVVRARTISGWRSSHSHSAGVKRASSGPVTTTAEVTADSSLAAAAGSLVVAQRDVFGRWTAGSVMMPTCAQRQRRGCLT